LNKDKKIYAVEKVVTLHGDGRVVCVEEELTLRFGKKLRCRRKDGRK